MHIISLKPLREFWRQHPDAELALRRWFNTVERSKWTRFADVRAVFPAADQVEHRFVFNVGGNKWRIVAAIHFNTGKVYVRHVLTHADYDKGKWRLE